MGKQVTFDMEYIACMVAHVGLGGTENAAQVINTICTNLQQFAGDIANDAKGEDVEDACSMYQSALHHMQLAAALKKAFAEMQ